ncbi:MAG: hypothetical protein JEZ09_13865 [Salinivirgaceae bacterium]|nr:hypothetical protein [Salinivirgaceae bacterium]
MKKILIIGLTAFIMLSCQTNSKPKHSETSDKNETSFDAVPSENVKAFYFHSTRRCNTCVSIEKVVKNTLQLIYKGDVELKLVNVEEDKNKDILKEYNITSKTLLLVVNGEQINLTNEAFMYAVSKPEKLKNLIIESLSKTN